MEDKTLELMVNSFFYDILSIRSVQYNSYIVGSAEARLDGRNGLKRLVGRGGGERRGDQKSEGGPEIIDTFC